jgi:putative chitinase
MIDDIELAKLRKALPADVLEQLADIIPVFHITTKLRLAHFLAQCAHESGNFKHVYENLDYSAERLMQVHPKYFRQVFANEYAHNPVKTANRIYADRLGNNNEKSGDGYKYRGRGYIQLTGKNNYALFSKHIGEDCLANPDLVATKYPLASAAFFFDVNRLWKWCDVGSTEVDVKNLTRRINGGTIGLEQRIELFNKYFSLLKGA